MATGLDAMKAIFSLDVDLEKFGSALESAEAKAEASTKNISGTFAKMALGIGAAITTIVIGAMEEAIRVTTTWGLEMEHLGARMGMTSQQAATLVGVLERYGIAGQTAARSMQMMAMQVQQTQQALDPFATKMGRLLGSLRDANGQALNQAQVLDLVRQKIQSAGTETEKLEVAQQLLGRRMGGMMLPALKATNEEWDKQKASVEAAQGPVEKAAEQALKYKAATETLHQTIRGLEIELGTQLVPALTTVIGAVADTIHGIEEFGKAHPILSSLLNPIKLIMEAFSRLETSVEAVTYGVLRAAEAVHLVDKGTASAYANMKNVQESAKALAAAQEEAADAAKDEGGALETNEGLENKVLNVLKQRVQLAEKLQQFGKGTEDQTQAAIQAELANLSQQRQFIEEKLRDPSLKPETRSDFQEKLLKNQLETVDVIAKKTEERYQNEELHLKALGALGIENELRVMQQEAQDENIGEQKRLQIEAEIYSKKKQYEEDVMKTSRELGIASADDEISYRKKRASEELGKGNVSAAAQEIVKAKQLAIQQADEQMEFMKKIRTVSLQDEISYQKQKLNVVKGNAEEEMKVLGTIADLDKQLYDQRLQYALNYTQNAIDSYRKLQAATGQKDTVTGGAKENLTFAEAAREADRAKADQARTLRDVARGGGTEEGRSTAVQQSQKVLQDAQEAAKVGKQLSGNDKELVDAARDLLTAASGGMKARAPAGPNPTIGSITSSTEGLATNALARSTEIPNLDTSFTDLATRVRDVLLGTVPNIQNFSNALASAVKNITGSTGAQLNIPGGGLGPTGSQVPANAPLGFGGSTPAIPPSAGGAPQPAGTIPNTGQGGQGTVTFGGQTIELGSSSSVGTQHLQSQATLDAIAALTDKITTLGDTVKLLGDQVASSKGSPVQVQVGVDPQTGSLTGAAVNAVTEQLQQ